MRIPTVIIMASNVKRFMRDYHKKLISYLFVVILLAGVKGADAKPKTVELISVISGHELDLKTIGTVRLAGLLYETYLDGPDFLQQTLEGVTKVKIDLISKKVDRYGRKAAQVYLKDARWLQGEIVRQGQARVYPYEGEEADIRNLYLLEDMARMSSLGHWEKDGWGMTSALDEAMTVNDFHLVEGVVQGVANIKGVTYLNFGSNWRSDFTVRIVKKNLKKFLKQGFDFPILKGRKLRVRGWVFTKNGPMIHADNPLQFQILD